MVEGGGVVANIWSWGTTFAKLLLQSSKSHLTKVSVEGVGLETQIEINLVQYN